MIAIRLVVASVTVPNGCWSPLEVTRGTSRKATRVDWTSWIHVLAHNGLLERKEHMTRQKEAVMQLASTPSSILANEYREVWSEPETKKKGEAAGRYI